MPRAATSPASAPTGIAPAARQISLDREGAIRNRPSVAVTLPGLSSCFAVAARRRPQHASCLLDVIKMPLLFADDLIILVTFAGQEHDIAFAGRQRARGQWPSPGPDQPPLTSGRPASGRSGSR